MAFQPFKTSFRIGMAAICACAALSATRADALTVMALGTIDRVDAELSSGFSVGQSANLTLTFPDAPVDTSGNPSIGRYVGTFNSAAFGSYTFSIASVIASVRPGTSSDTVDFSLGSPTGADVGGLDFSSASLGVSNAGTSLLGGSTAFPFGLTQDDVDSVKMTVLFNVRDPDTNAITGNRRATANITSFSIEEVPAPIPLPAGVWLMATALGGLALLRRRPERVAQV